MTLTQYATEAAAMSWHLQTRKFWSLSAGWCRDGLQNRGMNTMVF